MYRAFLQQEGITDIPMRKRRKLPNVPEGPFVGPTLSIPEEEEENTDLPNCFMPHPDYISQSITELRQLQRKRKAELFEADNILIKSLIIFVIYSSLILM